ncbi:MAG TPA: phosphatidylserine/phosphatidylglycerophosphate/cardiolipin synthase family protein, partial [Myxococcales bacterium]|nr:phosphatidylserine/phosphatidylglycerophosphate/cardiolipin synthase family protein [Myxococcales bacterium]
MSYRRVLLAAGLGADVARADNVLRALAPQAEVTVVRDPDAATLAATAADSGAELIVALAMPPAMIPVLTELRKQQPIAVLWLDAALLPPSAADRMRLFCVAIGARAEASLGAFLRDHGAAQFDASVFTLARPAPQQLAAALSMAGIGARVKLVPGPPWRALEELQREGAVDLIVLTHFTRLLPRNWPKGAPILVLPPLPRREAEIQRPLDVPDLVDDRGALHVRIGYAFGVGRNPPVEDLPIAFVSAGEIVETVMTREGEAELATPGGHSLGVLRSAPAEPLAAVERTVTIVRPGARRLVLYDAELPADDLATLATARTVDLLGVRMRRTRSCHLLRNRLAAAGLEPLVIDASAVLEEGDATDAGEDLDALRL